MPTGTTTSSSQNRTNWNGFDQQGTLSSLRQASQDNSVPEQYRQSIRDACYALEQMQSEIQERVTQGSTSESMAAGAGGIGSDKTSSQKQGIS